MKTVEPQSVRWGPKDGLPPGITINRADDEFIPWETLKTEIESKLLNQVKTVPMGSTVTLEDFHGRKNWIVKILSPENHELGHIWFGVDPDENWKEDGLVRLGKPGERAEVWQVFERHSDNTYHRLRSFI